MTNPFDDFFSNEGKALLDDATLSGRIELVERMLVDLIAYLAGVHTGQSEHAEERLSNLSAYAMVLYGKIQGRKNG